MSAARPGIRRRYHPLVPAAVLAALAVPVAIGAGHDRGGPFVAWVLMGVAAGYSISGSV